METKDIMELSGDVIDLSELKGRDKIKELTLSGMLKNTEMLYSVEVESLILDNEDNTEEVRLNEIKGLKSLSLIKPYRNIRGLSLCSDLVKLRLNMYAPSSKDLSELSGLENLKELRLTYLKADSLKGIEGLKLEKLEIHNSKTLKDITAVEGLKD
ncbi:MAG: hypothetical protein MJ171_07205 [Clostridia bacterium]|nr:hypothetical protein [Clostridia bacterium]